MTWHNKWVISQDFCSNKFLDFWETWTDLLLRSRPIMIKKNSNKKSVFNKLMRSNQGHAKIQSKLYLNWLLIGFCDSIPAVQSIIPTISIQIRTQILNLTSNLVEFDWILIEKWPKLPIFRPKMANSTKFWYKSSFSID